jgi:medium-chain acyl-[acyl-carrier-protein] hydrolase
VSTRTPSAERHEWWQLADEARLSVLCIPWAGAGATPFSTWPERFAEDVSLCGLRLPGRESRFEEEPIAEVEPLVDLLADEVELLVDDDFALFGHCSGALVAFELTRELVRRGRPPAHLVVASQVSPRVAGASLEERQEPLWERVRAAGQIDPAVVDSPDMRELLGPAIAADLSISDTFSYRPGPPLELPITVFGGSDDPRVTHEGLELWREETTGPFALRRFEADHFFRGAGWLVLADAVAEALDASPA